MLEREEAKGGGNNTSWNEYKKYKEMYGDVQNTGFAKKTYRNWTGGRDWKSSGKYLRENSM